MFVTIKYSRLCEISVNLPVILDSGIELSNTRMCPSASDGRNDVTKHIALRDRPVNVRNHYLLVPFVQVNIATAPRGPLQCNIWLKKY